MRTITYQKESNLSKELFCRHLNLTQRERWVLFNIIGVAFTVSELILSSLAREFLQINCTGHGG